MFLRAYTELQWYAGVMFWQYNSDAGGKAILFATFQLATYYRKRPIYPQHDFRPITIPKPISYKKPITTKKS